MDCEGMWKGEEKEGGEGSEEEKEKEEGGRMRR